MAFFSDALKPPDNRLDPTGAWPTTRSARPRVNRRVEPVKKVALRKIVLNNIK
jgi:hypothetical protein